MDESGNINNVYEGVRNTKSATRVTFTCNVDDEDADGNTSMVQISPVNSKGSMSSGYTCVSVDQNITDLSASLTTSSSTLFSRIRQMFN